MFRVAVISPHRDDAAFSCGVLIAALVRARAEVTVVNIFTVSDYTITPEFFPFPIRAELVRAVSQARRREDEAFVQMACREGMGSLRLHDLACKDAPLRFKIATERVLESPLSQKQLQREARQLAGQIASLVHAGESVFAAGSGSAEPVVKAWPDARSDARMATDSAVAYDAVLAPLALGGHIDHVIAREAARLAVPAEQLGFYEDLPYSARMSGVEREQQADDATRTLANTGCRHYTLRLPGAPHLKARFAENYVSQVSAGVVNEMAEFSRLAGDGERWYSSSALAERLATAVSGIATVTRSNVVTRASVVTRDSAVTTESGPGSKGVRDNGW